MADFPFGISSDQEMQPLYDWLSTSLNKNGTMKFANAAPADASIVANQLVLWFDATDGAAKLMVKGKSANGTVVTGSVSLT